MKQISEHCWIASSRFCRMNTVVIRGSAGALVIDPGVHGDELSALAGRLSAQFGGCGLAISTHPHWDHLLWTAELGQVPRLASERACEIVREAGQLAALRAEAVGEVPECELELLGQVSTLADQASNGEATAAVEAAGVVVKAGAVVAAGGRPEIWRLEWDGPELEFIVHDGHAPGHLGLRLPGDGVLIAGDMCSDDEVPLLDLNGLNPLDDYWDGLAKLARLADQCDLLVPGHGGVARSAGEIVERFERDHDYLRSLASGRPIDDARLDAPGREWLILEHEAMVKWCLRSRSS